MQNPPEMPWYDLAGVVDFTGDDDLTLPFVRVCWLRNYMVHMVDPPEMPWYDLAFVAGAATDVAGVVDLTGDDDLTLPCVRVCFGWESIR